MIAVECIKDLNIAGVCNELFKASYFLCDAATHCGQLQREPRKASQSHKESCLVVLLTVIVCTLFL